MKAIVLFEDLVKNLTQPLALLGEGGERPPKAADVGLTTHAPGNTGLATGEVRRISSTSGRLCIECESGRLWITDGQRGDVLLEAGNCFETAEAGGAIIEALARARFNVTRQARTVQRTLAAPELQAPDVIPFPATHKARVSGKGGAGGSHDSRIWMKELHKTAVGERVIFGLLAVCGAALIARFLGLFW